MKCFAIELFINESQDILTCIVPCSDLVIIILVIMRFMAFRLLLKTWLRMWETVFQRPQKLKISQESIAPDSLENSCLPPFQKTTWVFSPPPPKPRTWLRHCRSSHNFIMNARLLNFRVVVLVLQVEVILQYSRISEYTLDFPYSWKTLLFSPMLIHDICLAASARQNVMFLSA